MKQGRRGGRDRLKMYSHLCLQLDLYKSEIVRILRKFRKIKWVMAQWLNGSMAYLVTLSLHDQMVTGSHLALGIGEGMIV